MGCNVTSHMMLLGGSGSEPAHSFELCCLQNKLHPRLASLMN